MPREATIHRSTSETSIQLTIKLDGSGVSRVSTGIAFFDHMLTLFSKHGLMDLDVAAKGDIEVDFHHTVEDTGIALGQAITQALGDKAGIRRYGFFYVPMDEALVRTVVDLSGRPFLAYNAPERVSAIGGNFELQLAAAFLRALARRAETSGWIRIAVPTSLRPQGNGSFCNLVSMVFLDRTASQAARDDVLADISREMSLIKERSLGHAMLRFLGMGGLGRGLFMKPFLRSGRTETTAVLSNLGRLFEDPAWQHPVGFRPIATDTVSPLRPGTNVSLSASHCDGRLSLTLRYDESALDAEMARRMLSEVIDESISLVTDAGRGLSAPCGQTR